MKIVVVVDKKYVVDPYKPYPYQMCSCSDCESGCDVCECENHKPCKPCKPKSDCSGCFTIPRIVVLAKNAQGPCGKTGILDVRKFVDFPSDSMFFEVLDFNKDYLRSAKFLSDGVTLEYVTASNPPIIGKTVEGLVTIKGVSPDKMYESLGMIDLGIRDLCRFVKDNKNCDPCTGSPKEKSASFVVEDDGKIDFEVS